MASGIVTSYAWDPERGTAMPWHRAASETAARRFQAGEWIFIRYPYPDGFRIEIYRSTKGNEAFCGYATGRIAERLEACFKADAAARAASGEILGEVIA